MKELIEEFLNTPRKGIIHLNIFWRLILFPTIFVWWFLFQLFVLSCFCGCISIMFGIVAMLGAFGSSDWQDDFAAGFGFIILPIISPFIWLYRYFRFGEFNTLIEE